MHHSSAKLLSRLGMTLALCYAAAACAIQPAKAPHPKALPEDVVLRSARPFYGLQSGRQLSPPQLSALLTKHPALCVGESHDDPVHHYVQVRVLSLLASRAQSTGEKFAAGFEMFQSPYQPALHAYAAGELSEPQLLRAAEYESRWGFDFSLYRPLLETARKNGAVLLALNAPKEWTKAVAKNGLYGLAPSLKAQLPELVLDDEQHRSFFTTAMGAHPLPKKAGEVHRNEDRLERYYQAQVVWDESMASVAADWLSAERRPARLIVFAGAGHCHKSAIPRRFERRTGTPMLSVRPVAKTALGESAAPRDDEFDLLLVYLDDAAANAPVGAPPSSSPDPATVAPPESAPPHPAPHHGTKPQAPPPHH